MNILLLTPKLNNYHVDIELNLKKKGHSVKWYCSNLVGNNVDKFLNIINKNYISNKFDTYIDYILETNSNIYYDKVILIFGGNNFKKKHVLKLKQVFNKAEFIYYNWDSITNYPGIKDFYQEFDKYYSFDKNDCIEYGFKFLPLFYCNEYLHIEPEYDLFTIMSYGSNKEKGYKMIKSVLPDTIKTFEYLYTPNKLKIYFDIFFNRTYLKNINKNNLHFFPMSRDDVYHMIAKSKTVLDTPRINQNGLTIRTFETLNQRRKLITTNKNIRNYEFYCPDNIMIVDDSLKSIPIDFFEKPFNTDFTLNAKYSLDEFVNALLR